METVCIWDLGSGMEKSRIRDPGSGINIPDPPHWILLPNSPRCHGSYYPVGWRIGVADPTIQWASGYVMGILLPNGPANAVTWNIEMDI
jgi:hypothetical protein